MKTSLRLLILVSSLFAIPLLAQKQPSGPTDSLIEALAIRQALVADITDDREAAGKVLEKLRAIKNPSGMPVGPDADFAFAAMDMGHRLLAAGKLTAAEEFFKAVETSMQSAVAKTSDEDAGEKVQYLTALADVRGKYLAKPAEAKAALDAALKLKPDDPRLKYLENDLATRRGESGERLKQAAESNQKGDF